MSDAALESCAKQAIAVVFSARASVGRLVEARALLDAVQAACARGFFRPAEDELLDEWFARALNLRTALWESLEACSAALGGDRPREGSAVELRVFTAGYAAACLVARLDRFVVERLATDPLVQRKLNEPRPRHRIPRKQFTRVFESLTDPEKAIRMRRSREFVKARGELFATMRDDPQVGAIARELPELSLDVDISAGEYLSLAWGFARHAWTRRGASAKQKAAAHALEGGGRVVSQLRDTWTPKRIDAELRAQVRARLRPGDVLITRHDTALTNLFLPGYWPHAALFIGDGDSRDALGVRFDATRQSRARGEVETLEALKDGVRFRSLASTLGVDRLAVIRPRLTDDSIARALERAAQHEGKLYNFDFDFFRADRLVCTEVVYRAYDGVAGLRFDLKPRAGRPSLSAEDLLDMALAGDGFEPVLLFGDPAGTADSPAICEGEGLRARLAATYR